MAGAWAFRSKTSRENRRIANSDPKKIVAEILNSVTVKTGVPESRRLSHLNAFLKISKNETVSQDLGYTTEQIFYCLRPLLFLDSTKVKNATFRVVRHFVKKEEDVDLLNKLKYDYLIAREVNAGGLQLCRRILIVAPHKITHAPVQAVVSFTHPSHTDNLQSAALAFLAELALLNPDVFITCGGVEAIMKNFPCLKSDKMAEALVGSLLFLVNRPETRAKAGINLCCLTSSVYIDRALNTKNANVCESTVRWCTTAMVCLLKSWTGMLHVCQGKKEGAIASIVDSLYVTHLQKPMLEVMYQLFELTQPEWTDEMSVALEEANPSRRADSFRIAEGFVAAEVQALFPHLAKSRVNLVEVHQAVVLYMFLKANLLEAIVHVIVSEDSFLSVQATILLGEILHLVHRIIPPEVVSLTPGLPNLLSYAVQGRPLHVAPIHPVLISEEMFGNSVGLNKEARVRAVRAVCAIARLQRITPSPSLYLRHLLRWIKDVPKNEHSKVFNMKLFVLNSCEEGIKETGVLTERDPYAWNWEVIRAVLKRHSETLRKTTDSNKKLFLRRLMNFTLPVTGQYGRTELGPDRKSNNKITLAIFEYVATLLSAPEDSECEKLLDELLSAIRSQLTDLNTARSAHDCNLSPTNITNSLCQDYFLIIGQLTSSAEGRKALEKAGIYAQLFELASSTNQDCYVKLIATTLDFSKDESSRNVLKKTLESKSVSCRLYATKAVHAMLRIGVGHDKPLMSFLIGLIVDLMSDDDRSVAALALAALQEASHSNEYVEAIVEQQPCLLRHGDYGLLVLVRCLSTVQGFRRLHQANFVSAQLAKWGKHYNYRYVNIVESLLVSDKANGKEVFLPPHLYQQLASHPMGLAMVLADDHVNRLVKVLEKTDVTTDQEILETKAALYALSGIAAVMDPNVLSSMLRWATRASVYSLRAVAYMSVSNVATSEQGAEKLKAIGWYAVGHDRHEKWPLVKLTEEDIEPPFDRDTSLVESDKSHLFDLPEEDEDVDSYGDLEDSYWGVPGGRTQMVKERRSATLPHNSGSGQTHQVVVHNRSYSESKAEQSDSSTFEYYTRKSRSNSYTDSSTSGDSGHGRHYYNPRTLSPIPSADSLALQNPFNRRSSGGLPLSRSSLRGSRHSVLKSLEKSIDSDFATDLLAFGDILSPLPVRTDRLVPDAYWLESPRPSVEPDFSVVDPVETLPADSSSDDCTFNFPTPVYLGVCLPVPIDCILPGEEKNSVTNHVSFVSSSLRGQGLEDLGNPVFHKDICFLGTSSNHSHNVMIATSECECDNFVEGDVELEKESLDNDSIDSSLTDVPSFVDKPIPFLVKSRVAVRHELARMVEQLSNPILHKTCKQSLLQIKQAHTELFKDVCVFSDVCYILSTCPVRIASREFISELFDDPFDELWADASAYLAAAKKTNSGCEE